MQYTIYLVLAPLAGVISIISTFISWRRHKVAGFRSLTWILLFVCGFLFCNFFELYTTSPAQTLFFAKLSYFFIPFFPLLWIRFAFEYTGRQKLLQWHFFSILCLIPLATLICALIPQFNDELWVRYTLEHVGNNYMVMNVSEHGLIFWIFAVQAYAMIIFGAVLIISYQTHASKLYRSQAFWMISGAVLPLLTNFLYISQIVPGLTKDFSPIGYSLAGVCFTIGITRYQLLDLMPVARATLVEKMTDGVIVLDIWDRVLDMNPAARSILRVNKKDGIGSQIQLLVPEWNQFSPENIEMLKTRARFEVTHEEAGQLLTYEVRMTTLTDFKDRPQGKLILIKDETERTQASLQLKKAHDELERRVEDRTAELEALNATLEQRVINRTRELSVLYEISSIASQAANIETLLELTLQHTMTAVESSTGLVYLLKESKNEAEGPYFSLVVQKGVRSDAMSYVEKLPTNRVEIASILKNYQPPVITEESENFLEKCETYLVPPQSVIIAPILAEGKTLGLMLLGNMESIGYKQEDVKLLSLITSQIGLAVQSNYLRQYAIIFEERQRLSRDLHDSVTQSLYGLVTLTEAGQAQLELKKYKNLDHTLLRIAQTARQTLKEMRLYIYELRPPVLEKEGLIGAIQLRLTAVEGRSSINTRLLSDGNIHLPTVVTSSLYQIAQEALNNILRHTLASEVTVYLQQEESGIVLEITDNGCGFDLADQGYQGLGLTNMRERARKIHSDFEIFSSPGQGTKVKVTVPYSMVEKA